MSRIQKITKYRKFDGGGSTYYVPVETETGEVPNALERTVVVNSADKVHTDTKDPNSRGYGGSTIDFHLVDGTVDHVKGPWHSGPYGLYRDCGVLITDLCFTNVVIGTKPTLGAFMEVDPSTIIYEEKEFVLGPFMRGERIAQQLADILDKDLYCVRTSTGGGSGGWYKPGRQTHPMSRRDGGSYK